MLGSPSLVLNFIMKSPAVDNTLSDLMDVGDTVFKASMRKRIFFVFSLVTSNIFSSFECISYYFYPMVRIFQSQLT